MSQLQRRILIIGADGLRPDLITKEQMPTVYRLIENGTRYTNFTSAYPSETRVSMSSLTTGVYPGKHGVVANLMYIPGFKDNFVQTGNDQHLLQYKLDTGEPILFAPTLGDRLHSHGMQLSVAASSSPGASLLWNINHPENIINPASDYRQKNLVSIHHQYGADLQEDEEGVKLNRSLWATQTFIAEQLKDDANQVMVLWLAEPDSSQHYYGLGSPENHRALKTVDHCLRDVLHAMEKLRIQDELDILFLSDHGHSTVEAIGSLEGYLEKACTELEIENDFVTAGNYIYMKDGATLPIESWQSLISWFQKQDWCEAVYTDKSLSHAAGTLSSEKILGPITHQRAPQLIINPIGTDKENDYGVPGTVKTLTNSTILRAAHGTLSPYDQHAVCIGYGPSFEKGKTNNEAHSIVDIAPTICHILDLNESGFDGRSILMGGTEKQ